MSTRRAGIPGNVCAVFERWRSRRQRQASATAELRLIGYWSGGSSESGPWPDARLFVDRAWASETREVVADYLMRGRTLNQYRGLSPCRFCGRSNGSKELTDGTYCWPEGLAHYLVQHDVRLPSEFVAHVESLTEVLGEGPTPVFDHLGQRVSGAGFDDEYEAWTAELSAEFHASLRLNRPLSSTPPNWLDEEINGAWWRDQAGWKSQEWQ